MGEAQVNRDYVEAIRLLLTKTKPGSISVPPESVTKMIAVPSTTLEYWWSRREERPYSENVRFTLLQLVHYAIAIELARLGIAPDPADDLAFEAAQVPYRTIVEFCDGTIAESEMPDARRWGYTVWSEGEQLLGHQFPVSGPEPIVFVGIQYAIMIDSVCRRLVAFYKRSGT